METISDSIFNSIDRCKSILSDINEGYFSVRDGYNRYRLQSESENPNFFKTKGGLFDITVLPPTEQTEYWSLGVFATRKGLQLLARVYYSDTNYGSGFHNRITRFSTDETFFRPSGDTLEANIGFLSGLITKAYHNEKAGFVYRISTNPYSQEMMNNVVESISDMLEEAIRHAIDENDSNIKSFLIYTKGRLRMDEEREQYEREYRDEERRNR